MKLNFDKPFVGLNGSPISDTNQGETLATALSESIGAKENDSLKFWGWAQKIYKKEEVDLDLADQKKLREFIENTNFKTLAKAQLLETLEKTSQEPKPGRK